MTSNPHPLLEGVRTLDSSITFQQLLDFTARGKLRAFARHPDVELKYQLAKRELAKRGLPVSSSVLQREYGTSNRESVLRVAQSELDWSRLVPNTYPYYVDEAKHLVLWSLESLDVESFESGQSTSASSFMTDASSDSTDRYVGERRCLNLQLRLVMPSGTYLSHSDDAVREVDERIAHVTDAEVVRDKHVVRLVRKHLCERLCRETAESFAFDGCSFVNPTALRSIPDVSHAQVFLRSLDPAGNCDNSLLDRLFFSGKAH
ncbi:MAG: hypothetical protein MHM6MM_006383 [Cercozoa sp. M6MM]